MLKKRLNSIIAQIIITALFSLTVLIVAGFIAIETNRQTNNANNLLNLASLQRADVFRLSELSRRLDNIDWDRPKADEQEAAIIHQIEEGIGLFDEKQLAFRNGSQALGITAIDDLLLLSIVDDLDNIWTGYRAHLLAHTQEHQQDKPDSEDYNANITSHVNLAFSYADRLQRAVAFDVAKIQQSASRILILLLAITLVIILFTGLLFNRIINNLNTLRRTAQQFSSGNYTARANTKTYSELADVGTVLNAMADSVLEREQVLQKMNLLLEERVEERTSQLRLARDEAIEAQKAAQENSRLKSEFLSTMSHELRTPLNAINGYCGLLQMGITGTIDEQAKETIFSIQESGEHLLGLINDVLDISKIEAGRMKIISESINIRATVESWERRISVLANDKNLTLNIEISPDLPTEFYSDEERLTQIANNLLSNAVKFTDTGSVSLHLKNNGADQWSMQVIDTGAGIPLEAQGYIFDEFRQVDGSYSRNHGGTGLGLAIVRKIVQAMGGHITLSSEVGQGSTFTVMLPLHAVEAEVIQV